MMKTDRIFVNAKLKRRCPETFNIYLNCKQIMKINALFCNAKNDYKTLFAERIYF